MSASVVALVLLAAVMHASWNTLVKVHAERFTIMSAISVVWGLIAIAALPFVPIPPPAAWPLIVSSTLLHVGYNLFLIKAYEHGDLGQVYPIARGASPVLVMLFAALFAGEAVSLHAGIAVGIVSVGIASLSFANTQPDKYITPATAWALGTSVWIAGYTVSDGMGARVAESPHAFFVWLNFFSMLPLPLIGIAKRGPTFLKSMATIWKPAMLGGALSAFGYWIIVWAMTEAPLAAVSALRETSVIMATLIGVIVLKESFGVWRVASAAIVAAGIALLRFSA
jgi:drug/metabolite transporter (DMT)-like permease